MISNAARASKYSDSYSFHRTIGSPNAKKSKVQVGKNLKISSALPETAASIAVAATVVGAAATLLVRRTKASAEIEVQSKTANKLLNQSKISLKMYMHVQLIEIKP